MPAPVTYATLQTLIKIETDDCTLWPHSITTSGYPQMTHPSGERYAHRAALIETVGIPADGMQAAHSCGNRTCVNPRHLRWATSTENEADKIAHGRRHRGETHWSTAIKNSDVAVMKQMKADGYTYRQIGERFGMHRASASRIIRGKSWAWASSAE